MEKLQECLELIGRLKPLVLAAIEEHEHRTHPEEPDELCIEPDVGDNYDRSFQRLMVLEGHRSDHPADPGGETVFGISRVHFPDMYKNGPPTEADAYKFFRDRFWKRMNCDELPLVVAGRLFDAAVNVGITRATRWLQEGCMFFDPDQGLVLDSLMGPATRAATVEVSRRYPEHLGGWLTWRQSHYYLNEVRQSLRETFTRGWMRRIGMPL